MDTNNNPYQQQYQFQSQPVRKNGMATASMVMGVLTIITTVMCTVYIPFITGSLAILFAILSKGSDRQMNNSAHGGTVTGVIGLVMNVVLIFMVFYLYSTVPMIHDQSNQMFEDRYGVTIDEMWDEMTQ